MDTDEHGFFDFYPCPSFFLRGLFILKTAALSSEFLFKVQVWMSAVMCSVLLSFVLRPCSRLFFSHGFHGFHGFLFPHPCHPWFQPDRVPSFFTALFFNH